MAKALKDAFGRRVLMLRVALARRDWLQDLQLLSSQLVPDSLNPIDLLLVAALS